MNIIETSPFKWLRLLISFPTRSVKVMWLLNELNIPIRDVSQVTDDSELNSSQDNAVQIRFVRSEIGEHLNPKKNPHPFLKIPCLEYQLKTEEKPHVLFESNAILLFLLEAFDAEHKLAPTGDLPRIGTRFQIMMWVNSAFELDISPTMKLFKALLQKKGINMMNKHLLTFEREEKEEFDKVSKIIRESHMVYMEKLLANRSSKYLFSDEMDVADICLGFALKGCETANILDETIYPECKKFHSVVCARPSHGKAMQQMMKMYSESVSK